MKCNLVNVVLNIKYVLFEFIYKDKFNINIKEDDDHYNLNGQFKMLKYRSYTTM